MKIKNPNLLLNFLACCTLLTACFNQPSVETNLARAEALMRQYPDSAYFFLENIDPARLKGKDQADYCKLRIWYLAIKNNPHENIDSLLHIVLKYYENAPDTCIFYWSKAYTLLQELPTSDLHADIRRDMAHLYRSIGDYEQATQLLLQILQDTASHYRDKQWVHPFELGKVHQEQKKYDSALFYMHQALGTISINEDPRLISSFNYEVSSIYLEQKDFKAALAYNNKAMALRGHRIDAPLFNLAKAKIFLSSHMADSARYYLKKAIQSPNSYVATLAYAYLAELEKGLLNYKEAYNAWQNYNELFHHTESQLDLDILSQQYKEEKMKNEIGQLKLRQQEQQIFLLISLLTLLLLFIGFYFFYVQTKRKKALQERLQEEQRLKDLAQLSMKENLLLKKEQELAGLNEKAAQLRALLFKKMSMAQKLPSLEGNEEEADKRGKRILLTKEDLHELINTIDQVYAGFVQRLKMNTPALTPEEIEFCCLVKIKTNMQDLSDIYCVSKAGITKRKTRLKNSKFNLLDSTQNLDEFLEHF